MNIKAIIPIIVVGVLILILERIGFVITLGAHPFWATKVTYIGIAIGVTASLATMIIAQKTGSISFLVPVGFFILTIVIAAVTLLYGKAEFSASYAENAFAGRVWYIGFMALIAGIFATTAVILQKLMVFKKRSK